MGDSPPVRQQRARRAQGPTLLRLWVWLVLALAALLNDRPLWADPVAEVRFRSIAQEQGLSQASAGDILEDRNGFLWVATQDGLNRYDGYGFRVYRHVAGDPATLSDNYVLALAEDTDGGIWAATQNGLNRLDPRSGRLQSFGLGEHSGGLLDAVVIAVDAGADGAVYASTRRGGVQRWSKDSGKFAAVTGMPAFSVRQKVLHILTDGHLLIANDSEIWEVDPVAGASQQLPIEGLAADANILVMLPRPEGGYAIGCAAHGLLLVDAQGKRVRQLRRDDAAGLPDDLVRALYYDRVGRLWIGTGQGLARIEGDGRVSVWRQHPGDRYALPANRISALLGDRQGLLWVGTWTGGLARFDPDTERFRVIRNEPAAPQSLPANAVTVIAAGAAGRVWLGMIDRGGVVEVAADGNVLRNLRSETGPEPRLADDDISGLLVEPRGVWVGYSRGGLDLLQSDGGARRIAAGIGPMALPASATQALALGSDGTLWIGLAGGGVYSLCGDCVELRNWPVDIKGQQGPLGNAINDIVQTADGVIWFAVRRGGLSWYDPRTRQWGGLTAAPGPLALPHESVTAVLEDDRHTLWIGTQGGGISKIERDPSGRPAALTSYGEAQGLVSGMVGSILDGGAGELWISTTRGLCKFAIAAAQFACLGDRDPLLGVDFFVSSAARDSAGGLHFGSSQGLISIPRPAAVHFEVHAVPLLLTELRIGNRPVTVDSPEAPLDVAIEYAERLQLRHDQDLVAIEFAALDLRRANALRYRYRLLGRDDEWIDTDATRRVATFTGLPSGRYQFEVEALDGSAEVGRRTLVIDVLPAPWLGLWARIAYALLLAVALALVAWRYRQRLRERERSQDALAQSEAMLKYALWGSRGELWDADLRTGKMLRRNRLEHLDVTRHASADTLAAYSPFVHEDDRTRFKDALVACVKGASDLFECSYRSPDLDGQWRWLLSRGRVFTRDAHGRAVRMVGTTFDITELRANEEALRSSEDRLNLALWGSGDEMWDIDLPGGNIRRENRLAATELGADVQFPRLADYMVYVHPSDQKRLSEAMVAHLKGETEHFECSYRTRARGGGWVWLLGKGRVLERDAQGRALRMVGTNRDISQLKQVEDDLRSLNDELELRVQRRTEALEQANADLKRTLDQLKRAQRQLVESEKLAALGGLVAGVAHEINTPLGVGVTAASHLQHETERLAKLIREARMTRADLDHFLEQAQLSSDLVLRNLDRASQLVRSFKQVAVDQSSEQRRSFQVREYLAEVLLSLHPRIKKNRTQVEIRCPEDLVMDTFPGALYQIVVNLVINSLVHAFDEEHPGRIDIEVSADGEDVVLDYRDDGKGMSEAVQKRVFEPFFTTRRGSGGSGLGLHIVYNLATQALHGRVSCDSTLGVGTHFRLTVPRVTPGKSGESGEDPRA